MNIKIEKGIPLPPLEKNRYPFGLMEVGDSFFIENIETVERCYITTQAKRYFFKKGITDLKIVSRKEQSGYRFYLIEKL